MPIWHYYVYNCSLPSCGGDNDNSNHNNNIHDPPFRNKVGNDMDYLKMKWTQVVYCEE